MGRSFAFVCPLGRCCLCWPVRGLARSHRDHTVSQTCAVPVGAGKPANRPGLATQLLGRTPRAQGR
ncbi:hypothetical protein C6A77_22555 [Pseudomonas sp. AFG_SD02_1510_Pfu_092]|nr:hypothetical protein C6A77_22555 [Pseudomonas sp. AFG_SD02_1510_Pfu_092]